MLEGQSAKQDKFCSSQVWVAECYTVTVAGDCIVLSVVMRLGGIETRNIYEHLL